MPQIEPNEIYNLEDVGKLLGLSIFSVRRYCRSGKIRAVKVGYTTKILGENLLDFLRGTNEPKTRKKRNPKPSESEPEGKSKTIALVDGKGKPLTRKQKFYHTKIKRNLIENGIDKKIIALLKEGKLIKEIASILNLKSQVTLRKYMKILGIDKKDY